MAWAFQQILSGDGWPRELKESWEEAEDFFTRKWKVNKVKLRLISIIVISIETLKEWYIE